MSSVRPIEIIGGGLAGLSLGLALQRSGVPTTIFEAGHYPRHRVCGEFIAGLKDKTIDALGLREILSDARRHSGVNWYRRDRLLRQQNLDQPAVALSRYALDARLAQAFEQVGGQLRTGTRISDQTHLPGRVHATGRRRASSEWLGLKLHVRDFKLTSDLEFHLGDQAYVGLCGIEDDEVNVCGLFRVRPGLAVKRGSALLRYLLESGLGSLAKRISAAQIDEVSISAVAGFTFDSPKGAPDQVCLGDAYAMIPPFTGNGMAIAFQSSECALSPLLAWAQGQCQWSHATAVVAKALRSRFDRRVGLASRLHPFLLSPGPQSLFAVANRVGLLPLRTIANAIHD